MLKRTTVRFLSVLLSFLIGVSMTGLFPAQALAQVEDDPLQEYLIDDFEKDTDQWEFSISQEIEGGEGKFERVSTDSHTGSYAGKLTADFTTGGVNANIKLKLNSLDIKSLSFWVKPENVSWIYLRFVDSTGQTHQQEIHFESSEWQKITITKFNGGTGYGYWGGVKSDGIWHGPASELDVSIHRNGATGTGPKGEILLDDVKAEIPESEQEEPTPDDPNLQDYIIDDFEKDNGNWDYLTEDDPTGHAKGSYERTEDDAHGGDWAGELSGDFSNNGVFVRMEKVLENVDIQSLSFWIKPIDIDWIYLWLIDSTGQIHQQAIHFKSEDWQKWQKVTITKLNGGDSYGYWSGAGDGVWHAPASKISINIHANATRGPGRTGSFLVDDIVAKIPVKDLAIHQTSVGNVFEDGETAAFQIETASDAISWRVLDVWNRTIKEGTEDVQNKWAEITLPDLDHGYYTLEITGEKEGKQIKAETSMAMLSSYDFSTVKDSPFGVSAHFQYENDPQYLPLLQKAGIKDARDELYWSEVEKEKGVYTHPQHHEDMMNRYKNNNINPFIILNHTNPLYDDNGFPYTDEGRKAFANYGVELLDHYQDQMKWVEVYNEFNLTGEEPTKGKPSYYYDLLKETYEAVKKTHPDVAVVGPTTSGAPVDWLKSLFALGGLKYLDVVSIHPYPYPAEPETLLKDIAPVQDLIKEYNNGQPKPLWITECGWPTHKAWNGVSEETQADYLVRSIVLSLTHGVEKFYWYTNLCGLDEGSNEANFGFSRGKADPRGAYVPKPAYVTYSVLTRELTNASYIGQEDIGENIYCYKFQRDGKDIRTLWSSNASNVTLKTDGSVRVTDMVGKETILDPDSDGNIYLTASDSPLYLEGTVSKIVSGGPFSLQASDTGFVGQDYNLKLLVDTSSGTLPENTKFSIEDQEYPLQNGSDEVSISIPWDNISVGTRDFIGNIISNDKRVGMLTVNVAVSTPLSIQAVHSLVDDKDIYRVKVYNNSKFEYQTENINWSFGDQIGSKDISVPLPGSSEQTIDLPIPTLPSGQTYDAAVTLNIIGTPSLEYAGKITINNPESYIPIINKKIKVDGKLDQLDGITPIVLQDDGRFVDTGGNVGEIIPDDLSGKLWITYDANNLYLSAEILDDIHCQTSVEGNTWLGDGMQFAVSAGAPGETDNSWTELGAALTPEGPQAYRWIPNQGLVDKADLAIQRDDAKKLTTYELAYPWDEIQQSIPTEELISISLLVNDNDGSGRKGWIEWGSGIGRGKDPSLFKGLRFSKPETIKLDQPTGLKWDVTIPGKADWNEVNNSTDYSVQLYKDNEKYGDPVTSREPSYDFTKVITEDGSYSFTVTAHGDRIYYIDSDISEMSAFYNYRKPSEPTYTLQIVAGKGGRITSGTNGVYAAGTKIAIKATANNRYKFRSWITDNGGTFTNDDSASTVFTMPANHVTITAKFSYIGGNSDDEHESPDENNIVPPVKPEPNFVSDTTWDFAISGTYQFKITSKNGKAPIFAIGTPGVFEIEQVVQSGNDYFFTLKAVGVPGEKAGIYINGGPRLLIATVKSNPNYVKLDTGKWLTVHAGQSYQFKVTSAKKPTFVCGTPSAFHVTFAGSSGNDYFFKVTAIGKQGQSAGFYLNGEKVPRTIGNIIK